ncbi:MAG: hypothetical protein ACTSR2_12160 [Candidatus Hodarchaeales archaeon]
MLFSDTDNIDLNRYKCAKCGKTPQEASDLFKGCQCGHRLFRIVNKSEQEKRSYSRKNDSQDKDEMEFLTIRERDIGVYDINVEKLLGNDSKDKAEPLIVGNKGVFSIRLD